MSHHGELSGEQPEEQSMNNVASQTDATSDDSLYLPLVPDPAIAMAMSTDTSPQHAARMQSAFHTGPMSHHPAQHAPPLHMHPSAYHDSSSISAKDELLPPHMDPSQHGDDSGEHSVGNPTPTKGKNGATGPADGKTKPHICQICKRGFTTGGHLQRHQRIHTGVKAFLCPFPGCETRTSRQDNLQQQYVSISSSISLNLAYPTATGHISPQRCVGDPARRLVRLSMQPWSRQVSSRHLRVHHGNQRGRAEVHPPR